MVHLFRRIRELNQCFTAYAQQKDCTPYAHGLPASPSRHRLPVYVPHTPILRPQEDSWFVGRIVSDSEGGASNAASLMLEGDIAVSGGARATLDLSLLQSCRLFPGQIVGVRGFNPTGARIVARQVVTHVPPPAGPTAADAAMDVDGVAAGPIVAVAVGPFTTADDPTGFAPLEALLSALGGRGAPPVLLVLMGPFVDVEQPAIASGNLDVTFQSLFTHQVGDGWVDAGGGANARVVKQHACLHKARVNSALAAEPFEVLVPNKAQLK